MTVSISVEKGFLETRLTFTSESKVCESIRLGVCVRSICITGPAQSVVGIGRLRWRLASGAVSISPNVQRVEVISTFIIGFLIILLLEEYHIVHQPDSFHPTVDVTRAVTMFLTLI